MRMSESNMEISFVYPIQPLEGGLIVEMNIDHDSAVRESKCCAAANPKTHNATKAGLAVSLARAGCSPKTGARHERMEESLSNVTSYVIRKDQSVGSPNANRNGK